MAEENWLRVAGTAMALGVGLYLVPLAMVADPALIAVAEAPGPAVVAFGRIGLGLGLVAWGLLGGLRLPVAALSVVGGIAVALAPAAM